MYDSIFVTIHAYSVLLVGFYFSFSDKNANRLLYLIGYIVGSELIWRGYAANIFWESGKIFIIFFLIIIITRLRLKKVNGKIGMLFIFLLIPSLVQLDYINRTDLSHALLGPILIGIAVTVFSNIFLDRNTLINIMISILMPIITFFIITNFNTLESGNFNYTSAYLHRIETGGIGPNQASNILGLGALIAFILSQFKMKNYSLFFILTSTAIIIQTLLTHSRGGFWNTMIAIFVFYFLQLSTTNSRIKLLAGVFPLIFSFYYLIFPFLDEISGGSIVSRFSDADLTSREHIINAEIYAYKENPILGIGPGQGRNYRLSTFGTYRHTHTEYTRLIAEHGLFGLISVFVLIIIFYKTYQNKSGFEKSISMVLMSWGFLFMIHSATRLAAPCLLVGLATARMQINENRDSLLNY